MSFGSRPVPQPYPVYIPAPSPAPAANTGIPTEIATEADKAAEEVKKRAQRARGRNSTILTSPLGVQGAAPTVVKTLLGE